MSATSTVSRRAARVRRAAPAAAPAVDLRAEPGNRVSRARSSTLRSRAVRVRAPRHRLLLASTATLALGLLGVLLLSTVISQGAFRQHDLEVSLILLAEKEEALAAGLQKAEAPLQLEKRARRLGLVPAAAPVFLRLSDGAILGERIPAPPQLGKVDYRGAPGPLPSKKPKASPSPDATPDGAQLAATPVPAAHLPATAVPAPPTPGVEAPMTPAPSTPAAPTAGPEPAMTPAPAATAPPAVPMTPPSAASTAAPVPPTAATAAPGGATAVGGVTP
jgi:hypothetical protein